MLNSKTNPQAWIIAGYALPSRDAHQDPGLKKQLLEAKKKGALLSLAEIETGVEAGEVVAPFVGGEDKVSDMSRVAKRPRKGATSSGNILGSPAPGVPQDVHTEMERRTAAGAMAATTLEQRLRYTKKTGGTGWIVPQDWTVALAHGYIHPNLSPPQGLVWRAVNNVWKLCLRGG
eukprot:109793-Amphidinium_carterae.1